MMNKMTGEEMRKSSSKKKQKGTRKSSSDSSPTSFSSLPYDVALNCLARVSRTHYPILSLVSKSFQSLMASPDLKATRSGMGKNDKWLCVCLNLKKNSNPSWYILSSKHKLIPARPFPYGQYPSLAAVVSIGWEIYIIGGSITNVERSKGVYVLDCKSNQWRQLPQMCIARKEAYADVFDGKIYLHGGCTKNYKFTEVWGEVYDPKTQTWEPSSYSLKGVGGFLMSSVPTLVRTSLSFAQCYYYQGLKCGRYMNICVFSVIENNEWCKARVTNGKLFFSDLNPNSWTRVTGLEEIMSSNYYLIGVANSSRGGRRVTVWWKTVVGFYPGITAEIWCADIFFERRTQGIIWGVVEWFQNVFTFPRYESIPDFFFGRTAIVTL